MDDLHIGGSKGRVTTGAPSDDDGLLVHGPPFACCAARRVVQGWRRRSSLGTTRSRRQVRAGLKTKSVTWDWSLGREPCSGDWWHPTQIQQVERSNYYILLYRYNTHTYIYIYYIYITYNLYFARKRLGGQNLSISLEVYNSKNEPTMRGVHVPTIRLPHLCA